MHIKTLIVAGAMLAATTAFAQNQNSQGAPKSDATNAQGEQPSAGKTMQEKKTSITNDNEGAKGTPGSSGTQSGTSPNGATK